MQKIKVLRMEETDNKGMPYLSVEMYYEKGGTDKFGKERVRGYFLAVIPCLAVTDDSGETRMDKQFSLGVVSLVKKAQRFNQKTFNNLKPEGRKIVRAVEHVLKKNNMNYKYTKKGGE